ncbi:hypothetical protein HKX48_007016 [Thoreauomyces humboldtii]|nr:hypothetical protein HKX48_007016 [Thoreauomyces humboldtii]
MPRRPSAPDVPQGTVPVPRLFSPSVSKSVLRDPRPLTPESDDVDEIYDGSQDAFPFWYGSATGTQDIPIPTSSADAAHPGDHSRSGVSGNEKDGQADGPAGRRNSYADSDSVLHYFVATSTSEEKLDQYLSNIINAFLTEPTPIYAGQADTPQAMRERFSQSEVPVARRKSVSFGSVGEVSSAEEYLRTVKVNVIDRATRVSSPKMIGHMTTALPYFHRPLARLLTAMNQNVVKLETASTMTYLERQTIGMLHREFYGKSPSFYKAYMHSPEHSLGVFASGGTIANITAMWAARNRALPADAAKTFGGVEKEGLYKALRFHGYEGAAIVGSRLMHYSFKKAADLLGLGDDGLVTVDADDAFRMRTDVLSATLDALENKKILVMAVVGIAGTTETGSIDALETIAGICASRRIHFHVDAAWGGPLVFSPEHARKLSGIQHADTVTVDGHKQLYTPMGIGLLLFKHPTTAHSIRKTANYVIRHDSPDLGKFTLEGSRPATSLHLHASLYLLGRDGLACLVTRSATLARQLSVRIRTHPSRAFQALHEPETNIFLFRYIPLQLRAKVRAGERLTDVESATADECTRRVQSILATAVEQPSSSTDERKDPARRPSMTSTLDPSSSSSTIPAQTTTTTTTTGSSANATTGNGGGFVSRTRVRYRNRDVDAFRVVMANPLTSWDDVEEVIQHMVVIGLKVEHDISQASRPSPPPPPPPGDGAKVVMAVPLPPRVDETDKERWSTLVVPDAGQTPWIGWPYDL